MDNLSVLRTKILYLKSFHNPKDRIVSHFFSSIPRNDTPMNPQMSHDQVSGLEQIKIPNKLGITGSDHGVIEHLFE